MTSETILVTGRLLAEWHHSFCGRSGELTKNGNLNRRGALAAVFAATPA
jgi:hypothetical protein